MVRLSTSARLAVAASILFALCVIAAPSASAIATDATDGYAGMGAVTTATAGGDAADGYAGVRAATPTATTGDASDGYAGVHTTAAAATTGDASDGYAGITTSTAPDQGGIDILVVLAIAGVAAAFVLAASIATRRAPRRRARIA